MKNNLLDIIDFEKINVLLEEYYKSTGFVTAILDLEGNVLSKSGWRQICTEFHRAHPKTAQKCLISDTELANKMEMGEKYHFYKCLNGMVDVAFPIVIKGEHIANLFTGQLFFEKPDVTFFKKQAKKYGFNEKSYLDAMEKVPVISEEQVKIAMGFLLKMTELIVEMSVQKIGQIELNKTLKETTSNLEAILDNRKDSIWSIDKDYNYIIFNKPYAEVILKEQGVELKKGMNALEIQPAEIHEFWKSKFEPAFKGENVVFEFTHNLNGTEHYFQVFLNPIFTDGIITGASALSMDITERKQAEKALQESEARLKLALETNNTGAWDLNLIEETSYRTLLHDQIFGYETTLPHWNFEDFLKHVIPEDRKNVKTLFDEAIRTKTDWKFECRIQRLDGEQRWISAIGRHIVNSDGQSFILTGVVQDITERKHLEQEILKKNKNLVSLLEISQKLAKTLDLNTILPEIIFNATNLIGLDTGAIYLIKDKNLYLSATTPPIPDNFPEIFRHSFITEHPFIQQSISTGQPLIVPDLDKAKLSPAEQAIRKSRKMRTLLYVPLKIENQILGVMILGTTEKIRLFSEDEINLYRTMSGHAAMAIYNSKLFEEVTQLNEELEKRVSERTDQLSNSQAALLNIVEDLNEKTEELGKSSRLLEAKNKELETFTYSVSHDLKAPLRGIDGYSRLLEEEYYDNLKGDGQKFIKTIREGTKQMNQLIEDLLAYSRLERLTLRPSSINSKQFIDNMLAFFKDDILKKNVVIKKEITECQIIADSDGLTIALRNILENAIKFSSKVSAPEIKISLKENIHSWLLSVEDNGIGFDMKYQKRIFEIFQRLNLPEQFAGTGIGLAMVNKSIERMGGKIWAKSELGKGAKFYIEISKK